MMVVVAGFFFSAFPLIHSIDRLVYIREYKSLHTRPETHTSIQRTQTLFYVVDQINHTV